MSAPSPAKQLYLGPSGGPQEAPSFFSWFWKEQVVNPEHREGNLNIARAIGLFAVGVMFVRSDLGSALVPVF